MLKKLFFYFTLKSSEKTAIFFLAGLANCAVRDMTRKSTPRMEADHRKINPLLEETTTQAQTRDQERTAHIHI